MRNQKLADMDQMIATAGKTFMNLTKMEQILAPDESEIVWAGLLLLRLFAPAPPFFLFCQHRAMARPFRFYKSPGLFDPGGWFFCFLCHDRPCGQGHTQYRQ